MSCSGKGKQIKDGVGAAVKKKNTATAVLMIQETPTNGSERIL